MKCKDLNIIKKQRIILYTKVKENKMERKDLLTLTFYEREHFSGSDRGIRYRIEKFIEALPEGAPEDSEKPAPQLKVTIWPEPFSFENTDDSHKKSALFPFSEEGLHEVTDFINSNIP